MMHTAGKGAGASHSAKRLRAVLEEGLRPHEIRLEARHIAMLTGDWHRWIVQQAFVGTPDRYDLVAQFLRPVIGRIVKDIVAVREGQANFTRRYAVSQSDNERRDIVCNYARELGATRSQLRGDRRAFRRWFGPDAMQDRAHLKIFQAHRLLTFCLQSMGRAGAAHLGAANDPDAAWQRLALEETVVPLLNWDGDPRLRTEAFRCMAALIGALPPALVEQTIQDTTIAYVYRAALDHRLDVWIQREALFLLRQIAPQRFSQVLHERLTQPDGGDDLFVRRYAVELLGTSLQRLPALESLYGATIRDPSPFVRQALATALTQASEATVRACWPALGLGDEAVQVRAAAALQLTVLAARPSLFADACAWLKQLLRQESTGFGLRVGLKVAEDAATALDGEWRKRWIGELLPAIEELHVASQLLPVRRWAAETRERIWALTQPEVSSLAQALRPVLNQCRSGKSHRFPAIPAQLELEQVGRMLSLLAQKDFGIGLERRGRGWRVWRGHHFGFRLWRFLHEWRHPSPDKRQAFKHTIGRLFSGTVRAPSAILSELAETKVPGEPLHMGSEAGWRPYLPLVDEMISLLDEDASAGPLRLFTAEGKTEIAAPPDLRRRLAARSALTRDFTKYAYARNWTEGSSTHPATYLRLLTKLGYSFRFQPYAQTKPDPMVTRFFPSIVALPLPVLPERIKNYFFSAYDNTIFDLTVFIALAMLGFVGHHLYVNWRMHAARNGIPLVIGGWGTRGKSGTERLKAAMFNAQGYSIVSKTSGCEAMFLYSPPYGELRELFLFRPYDKATIWEQFDVVRLARRLGGEVFLWECMALTPAFVRLLQRAWMRDDLVTLTNTFPDHEDLQGPAGINIPEVMTNFIPRGKILLTTEEQMRPILQDAADALGTELKGVGWLESGLIPADILARFPYQEHPDNIALVAALGHELGIGFDYALKAMADRVVPDLGVLKTFAPASVHTRALEFSNGMSANERYGCLGNWKRLGFDKQAPETQPGVIISTVVNNRADRIARSRVFADVLVQDIRADIHVLIGSNLDGLQGYLRETWAIYSPTLTLWPEQPVEGGSQGALRALAKQFRIVHDDDLLKARLEIMLRAIGAPPQLAEHGGDVQTLAAALRPLSLPHTDGVLAFHEKDMLMRQEYAALEKRCETAGANQDLALDQGMRVQMWAWFERRVVVVDDYYASGDAIINTICNATPPGFHNRIMGLQNIKGTGLDFVYRWLAWDFAHRACEDMLARDPLKQRRGLSALASFQEYGLLSENKVAETLREVRAMPFAQNIQVQAGLDAIAANLANAMDEVRNGLASTRTAGWQDRALSAIEGFLDAGDAVRRRRKANRIYRDLVTKRISEARAVKELQALTQRQKGGWLGALVTDKLQKWRRIEQTGTVGSS